jgi:hypothetical protein
MRGNEMEIGRAKAKAKTGHQGYMIGAMDLKNWYHTELKWNEMKNGKCK